MREEGPGVAHRPRRLVPEEPLHHRVVVEGAATAPRPSRRGRSAVAGRTSGVVAHAAEPATWGRIPVRRPRARAPYTSRGAPRPHRRPRGPRQGRQPGAGHRVHRGQGRRPPGRRRPAPRPARRDPRRQRRRRRRGRGRRARRPRSSTGCASPTCGSWPWPTACARWPACPTRSARSPTAGCARTACGSSGSACRSASWRSSTRTGPTSPATPSGCASSRATPPSCAAPPAPSARTSPSPPRSARAWPRPGCPHDSLVLVEDTRHEAAVEFMRLRESIDVLIPRGGPSLIRSVLDNATVPYVIDGDGNCHVYVDAAADLDMAAADRRERQDPAARRCATPPRRCSSTATWPPPCSPTWPRGSRASSWSATTPPARSSATAWRRWPPTTTTPPSSST